MKSNTPLLVLQTLTTFEVKKDSLPPGRDLDRAKACARVTRLEVVRHVTGTTVRHVRDSPWGTS